MKEGLWFVVIPFAWKESADNVAHESGYFAVVKQASEQDDGSYSIRIEGDET